MDELKNKVEEFVDNFKKELILQGRIMCLKSENKNKRIYNEDIIPLKSKGKEVEYVIPYIDNNNQ